MEKNRGKHGRPVMRFRGCNSCTHATGFEPRSSSCLYTAIACSETSSPVAQRGNYIQ
ncbi:hypothetical protein C0J52_03042 [Blattella germanica]|nr:hypothetical protein C0J52_03042 [Blattella germanica]